MVVQHKDANFWVKILIFQDVFLLLYIQKVHTDKDKLY